MTFTKAAGSWSQVKDERSALSLIPAADQTATIFMWLDPLLVDVKGVPRAGITNTPAAFSQWLVKDANLVVSERGAPIFESATEAIVLDLAVSPKATNEDPGCPASAQPCVVLIKERGGNSNPWDIGMGQGERMRLYIVGVGQGTTQNTFVVLLDATSSAGLDSLDVLAQPVLRSLRLPATLP
jgi:hypothetical protein